MKKQIFFKMSMKRTNPIKAFFLGLFNVSVSMPRMICETFSRSDFGERYWNFGLAIVYTAILACLPIIRNLATARFGGASHVIFDNISWYLFLAAFMYKSIIHWQTQRRSPSTFDFAKYSYYSGRLNNWFFQFKWFGKPLNLRTTETIIEPAFFFLVGLFLVLLQQSVGILLLLCSVAYSGSRFMNYHLGDQKVLDIIDSIIIREDYEHIFMNEISGDSSRGLDIPSRRPKSMEHRKKVVDAMFQQDDEEQRTYVA